MADAVISFDGDTSRAEAKLRSLRRSAERTGRAFGSAQAGALAGRLGGQPGAMLGRVIGGGLVGGGLAVSGLAAHALLAADARRVEAARSRAEAQMRMDTARAAGAERRRDLYAGAMSQERFARISITRGLKPWKEYSPEALADRRGISPDTAAESILAASDLRVSSDQTAWLMATGEFGSPREAAEALRAHGGIAAALAAKRGVDVSEANAQLDRTFDVRAQNIGMAASATAPVFSVQTQALESGNTAAAIAAQVADAIAPEEAAVRSARDEIDRNVAVLLRAAEAQSKLAKAMQQIGRVIGIGEGSAQQRATEYIRANKD